MIRLLGLELAALLPKRDISGDLIELVEREDILKRCAGIIAPMKHVFKSINWKNDPGINHRLTWDEEIQRGNAEMIADLNTKEGKDAYLECWWPAHLDGAALIYTAQKAKDVPYPVHSQIRCATVILRLEPALAINSIRWGAMSITMTRSKALWDLGIRRTVWHPTESFYAWLVAQGATGRLTQMDPTDPRRLWTYSPTHPKDWYPRAFYLEMPDRPVTDDGLAWLKGTP